MLTLDHISKTFNPGTINEKRALDGLSLHLKPGDFVTVIGGNGAGKSTMLNAVAGVWPVDDGRIILDGVDVTAMPEFRRAQYIGRVFQDPMMGTGDGVQERRFARAVAADDGYEVAVAEAQAEVRQCVLFVYGPGVKGL